MLGTIDLTVIGLSVLCAVGSTLTYLLFLRNHGRQPQSEEARAKSGPAGTTDMREQIEQGKTTLQRDLHSFGTDRAHVLRQFNEAIAGFSRERSGALGAGMIGSEDRRALTVKAPSVNAFNITVELSAFDRHTGNPENRRVQFSPLVNNVHRAIARGNFAMPKGHYVHIGKGAWLVQKQVNEETVMNVKHDIGRAYRAGMRLPDKEPA